MSDSFRTMQAVSDLVHHVKPLLTQHLAAVAEASGLGLRETGEAFARLRDDGYWFQRDETLPLLDGLETIAITQAEGFDLAVVVLLADVLQRRQVSGLLTEAWDEASKRLRDWPATLRAAVANGLRRAVELDVIKLAKLPRDIDRLTRSAPEISEVLLRIARSMRRDEILAVAQAGENPDIEPRLRALEDLIRIHEGLFQNEIAGVRSNALAWDIVHTSASRNSAVGFEGCSALLLLNSLHQDAGHIWFAGYWEEFGAEYCGFKASVRDPILAGVRYLFEADLSRFDDDPDFIDRREYESDADPLPLIPIPVVDDL